MTVSQQLITIAAAGAATLLTRVVPFIAFRRRTPAVVTYLGRVLPAAVFGMLIVYCLKDVQLSAGTHGIPEALGIAAVVLVHRWRRNMLLSIATGTGLYLLLVNVALA